MRGHTKLRAFELADSLAIRVYRSTVSFPREEPFGLTSQMRRAAVSVASNIVAGCARDSTADYLRFLDMAYGSACELQYQISLARRFEYFTKAATDELGEASKETCMVLDGLIRSLCKPPNPDA